MSDKVNKKGYTVEGTVDIIKQRRTRYDDPGTDDNKTYQKMPFVTEDDELGDVKTD